MQIMSPTFVSLSSDSETANFTVPNPPLPITTFSCPSLFFPLILSFTYSSDVILLSNSFSLLSTPFKSAYKPPSSPIITVCDSLY